MALGEDTYENLNDLEDEPETRVNEDVIRNLVEQAKNEGIVPNDDKKIEEGSTIIFCNIYTARTLVFNFSEPSFSFYEQAMEILRNRPNFKDSDLDGGEVVENDPIKLPKLENLNDDIKRVRMITRQTENSNLINRSSASLSKMQGDIEESRDGPSPTTSADVQPVREFLNSPSQSASFLPKIDSRFLPSNSK